MSWVDDTMREAIGRLLDLSASLRSEGLPMHANEVMANADELTAARAAVAELVEADREYDEAFSDWHRATQLDPESLSDEQWGLVADRFEKAVSRRIAAVAALGESE